ncbi:MAG: UbiA prenyltransferase family protein [Candidatus Tectimicrobiota bacterium]
MPSLLEVDQQKRLWPYIQIARPDHWFKNVFMMLGVLLALFYMPSLFTSSSLLQLGGALIATCLIASSNYVLNELLDAPQDRFHPVKKYRPVPSGRIRPMLAIIEWLLLGVSGAAIAWLINTKFLVVAGALWGMGVAYNVPPVRTKEIPYLDVLSESVNNPIRLLLGWFALIADRIPPVSLILAYWMVGAFFMATKRFAEYRHINNREIAAQYRKSFRYYTEERLLVSMLFYVAMCALMTGIFIVRYHVELIIFVPFAAGFFAYYLKLGLQPDSPVQNPEKLFRERGFLGYMLLTTAVFILLMFTRIPWLYSLFNIEPSQIHPLWILGTHDNP